MRCRVAFRRCGWRIDGLAIFVTRTVAKTGFLVGTGSALMEMELELNQKRSMSPVQRS